MSTTSKTNFSAEYNKKPLTYKSFLMGFNLKTTKIIKLIGIAEKFNETHVLQIIQLRNRLMLLQIMYIFSIDK